MIHCAITLNGQQLTVRAHCDIDDLLLDRRHHSRVNSCKTPKLLQVFREISSDHSLRIHVSKRYNNRFQQDFNPRNSSKPPIRL